MNIDPKTGGPAFPFEVSLENGDGTATQHYFCGMTLRDYFAAKAMEGFLVCDTKYASDADMIARDAYVMADTMIKAREL